MRAHLENLKYILLHKWYVFWECCRLGIPWQGITHDLSKLRPGEFLAYSRYFYGPSGRQGQAPKGGDPAFDHAWLMHQKRSPHHWQYWILINDQDGTYPLPMPDRYRREMLADWIGASLAIRGKRDTLYWYLKNRKKILLHPETRTWIEDQLWVTYEIEPCRV